MWSNEIQNSLPFSFRFQKFHSKNVCENSTFFLRRVACCDRPTTLTHHTFIVYGIHTKVAYRSSKLFNIKNIAHHLGIRIFSISGSTIQNSKNTGTRNIILGTKSFMYNVLCSTNQQWTFCMVWFLFCLRLLLLIDVNCLKFIDYVLAKMFDFLSFPFLMICCGHFWLYWI